MGDETLSALGFSRLSVLCRVGDGWVTIGRLRRRSRGLKLGYTQSCPVWCRGIKAGYTHHTYRPNRGVSRPFIALCREPPKSRIAGAAYGFGSDTGSIEDRLDGAAWGGAAGALGGAGLQGAGSLAAKVANPVLDRLAPKLADARFAASQFDNPHVITDAEVSDDLSKLVQAMSIRTGNGKLTSKAQRRVLLDRVSDLERSYLPTEEVNALDLAP